MPPLNLLRQHPLSMAIAFALLLSLILYAQPTSQRPPPVDLQQTLFPGVEYQRTARDQPRPMMIHTLRLDLTTPGLRVVVSGGDPEHPGQAVARTTTEFLRSSGAQVAVNGSYFYPFREKTPWDFAPRSGDRAFVLGEAIAQGVTYAEPRPQWYPLCLSPQRATIATAITCPSGTEFGLAGRQPLIQGGRIRPKPNSGKPYAHLIAATNPDGTILWLMAVDGKQPFYSEGMTRWEAAQWLMQLGATEAIALDGGGSTTMAYHAPTGIQLLNAPIHAKIPMWERPVVNHIGVFSGE